MGVGKESNDDSFLIDAGLLLFAVADGVGSGSSAAAASRLAMTAIRESLAGGPASGNLVCRESLRAGEYASFKLAATTSSDTACLESLRQAVVAANQALYQAGQLSGRPMLSTVTLARLHAGRLLLAHCGDSRAYLVARGAAARLTDDHTVVADLHRRGFLSDGEIQDHPRRNALSSCLGQFERSRVDTRAVPLSDESVTLLLCTDGLSSYLADEQIAECLGDESPLSDAADRLLQAAIAGGSRDDVTVVTVRLAKPGL
jgi:serine/threonine protein phosphatase PrpC